MRNKLTVGLVAGTALAALAAGQAFADPIADFYAGKTITIVCPVGAGGTYDFYGRLGGEIMKRFLPGHPNYVMEYMPGAGGTRANNYVATVAARDGTVLTSLNSNTAQTQIMRPTGVKYDVTKFVMIGMFSPMNSALTVWHTAPAKTIQDAMKTQTIFGATGKGSYQYQLPILLNKLVGTKFKVVAGYKSVREENMAMERGEINGRGGTIASWQITEADWVRDHKITHLVQVGSKRSPRFPDVPLATDLVKTQAEKQMILLVSSGALLGRSLAGPPGIPAARVKALQAAFDKGIRDPGILALAKKQKLIIEPESGEKLAAIVDSIVATPKPVVQKVMDLLDIKNSGGGKQKK